MFTVFFTCGAEILCLEQNTKLRENVLETIQNDDFMGILKILYVGIHYTLYPKLLLAKESELGKVLNNFKYDVICPIIIWVIYIIETMMFTFLHPDAPKYKSKDE